MRAEPVHDPYARLPWLIAMMTVIVLAIGAFAAWYVENDMATSAPVRSMLWKLAAAWFLVWLPMLGFSLWSVRRLKQAWAHVRDERAHAETAESKYRELVEQADDIIYRVDLNGYFTYINSTVTRYKGYTQYELLGRHFTEHIRPDAREAARRFYLRQFARKTPSTYYEFPVIKKDGGEIWFGQHVQLLIENSQVAGFQAVARDITDRKYTERVLQESEHRYKTLFATASDAIFLIAAEGDEVGRILDVNRAAAEMHGYTQEELLAMRITDLDTPASAKEAPARIRELLAGKRLTFSVEHRRRDGTVFPIEVTACLIEIRNRRCILAFDRDISDRKKAEEALLSTTEFLRTLVQALPLAVINLDSESNVVSWNRAAEDMLGWSEAEVLGKPLPYVPPGKEAEADAVWSKSLDGPGVSGVEIRRRKKDGTPIDLAVWSRTIRDPQGSVVSSIGILVDITERKRVEEVLEENRSQLRESEARYRNLFEFNPLMYFMLNAEGTVVSVNPKGAAQLGYTIPELTGRPVGVVFPKDVHAAVRDQLDTCLRESDRVHTWEITKVRKDGALLWVRETAVAIRDKYGHPLILIMCEDITERKQAQERLAKINACFLSFGVNPETNINNLTALCGELLGATCALYNYMDGPLLRSIGRWNAPPGFNPVDTAVGHICHDVIKEGGDRPMTVRHLPETHYAQTDPNVLPYKLQTYFGMAVKCRNSAVGSLCAVFQRDFVPSEADQKLIGIIAAAIGVEEERGRAEVALRESEKRFRTIFDQAPLGIAVIESASGRFMRINREYCDITGYQHEDLLALTFMDITHPDDLQDDLDNMAQLLEGQTRSFKMEKRYIRKDNSIVWVNLTCVPLWLEDEQDRRFHIAMVEDITERKQAEEKLLLSREIIANARDPISIMDLQGRFTYQNPAHASLVGYSDDELLDKTPALFLGDDAFASIGEELRRTHSYRGEVALRTKQGALKEVDLSVFAIRDAASKPVCFVAIKRDITERKRTEEVREKLVKELAESKDRFEMFFRQTPSAIAITTIKEGRFLDVNKQAEILTGYSREELIGHTTVEMNLYVTPTERASVVQALKTKGVLTDLEREIRTKSGEVRTAIFSLVPILMGSEPCMLSIAHDITERKRAEEGLRERSRQQATEAELSLLAVTVQDLPILLQTAVELVANALEVNYCEVLERLPHSTQLRLCASAGWRGDRLGQVREAERGSLAYAAIHSNKPVASQDCRADGRFSGPPWLGAQDVISGLGVAIRSQEESWGALGVYRAGTRAFSRDDANFIQTISNVLAAAIERKQAETVLQNANLALRTLSRQLLQVQEQERRTIARDLHDEIGQSLTAIKLNVERAQRARDRDARVRIMKDSIQITEHVLSQVRDLSLDLHPSILDDLGLTYALKWYADRQAKRAGLNVVVEASPSLPRLSPHLEIACFRIAQEALTNVARHAKASRVNVTITQGASSVELRVQDDGVGFDVDAVPPPSTGRASVGLASMQERARLLGGLVRIISRPGRGTTVIALLPLGLTAPDEIPETEPSRP